MQRAATFLALLLVFGWASVRSTSTASAVTSADEAAVGWPLDKGSVWVYQGMALRSVSPGESPEVVEEPVNWTVEVVDVIVRGHVRAALMRGHLTDILGIPPAEAQPTEYLLIQVDGTKVYEVRSDERVAQALGRLRDETDLLVDLVQDADLVLDLPLQTGKHFCEAFQITRQDGDYCWVVDNEQPADVSAITGVDPTRAYLEYQIHKGAVGGTTVIRFVPGVGITSFFGVHFGVHWEAELHLVAFVPGEP